MTRLVWIVADMHFAVDAFFDMPRTIYGHTLDETVKDTTFNSNDQRHIVKLTEFLKSQPSDPAYDGDHGPKLALTWLREFIKHFEVDYNLWQEECKEMIAAESDELSEES